jgi:hypothetical protein
MKIISFRIIFYILFFGVLFELVLLAKKGFFKLPGGVLKPGDDEV